MKKFYSNKSNDQKKDELKALETELKEGIKAIKNSDDFKKVLDYYSKFYRYSANNCMLILRQCPDASYVASFKKWNDELDRHIKKGEKAIKILAPIPKKYIKETVNQETGEVTEEEINYLTFKAVPVFDVSQTDGAPLPEIVHILSDEVEDFSKVLNQIASVSPVPVSFEDIKTGANGYYHLVDKRIALKAGNPEAQTIKTLIHEISHAILADHQEKIASPIREVEAESTAYIVCKYFGLDTAEYSFPYIVGWSDSELEAVEQSLEIIKNTSRDLIEAIEKALKSDPGIVITA